MLTTLLLVVASFVAAYTDLTRRRIPNVLTFGLAAAALSGAALSGTAPLVFAAGAYLITLCVGTLPFSRGWIGGGDVKLLAAGAACAGWPGAATFFLFVAVAGGALALAELARTQRLYASLVNLATAAHFGTLRNGVILDTRRSKLPYALAIAAGALLLLASETVAPWLQLVHV